MKRPANAPGGPVRISVIGCGVIAYWTHLRELRLAWLTDGLRSLEIILAAGESARTGAAVGVTNEGTRCAFC